LAESSKPDRIKLVAFYLPQFHTIRENDEWWGEGFTEWRNVGAATPRFPGHDQPHVPGALGAYDLRDPAVRRAQAEMAATAGIDAFCYYHYWFHGRRLLEEPFEAVLRSGQPRFPFVLCWANENWTRSWSGNRREVLMEQRYSAEDDRHHARWLARAFADERYLRIAERPVFLVYRASLLPEPRRVTDALRQEAARAGLGDPLLLRVESFRSEHGNPEGLGFDGAVEFQPDWTALPGKLRWLLERYARRALRRPPVRAERYDYGAVVMKALQKTEPEYLRFPGVTPRWDNSPRRARGAVVLQESTPELYERWLAAAIERAPRVGPAGETLIFINAWNEWGEGAHLEPDVRWGDEYLQATQRARRRSEGS
jgi:lipopolysaccharide biosynthesis protein